MLRHRLALLSSLCLMGCPATDPADVDASSLPHLDVGAALDSGSFHDAAITDSGPLDASPADTRRGDSGLFDAGVNDIGTSDAGRPLTRAETRGQNAYLELCALCHGDEGEGYLADNANALANPAFLASATDAFLFDAIALGRVATPMSAWGQDYGGPLASWHMDDIVAFMRTWQREPSLDLGFDVISGDALNGEALYDAN